MAPRLLAQGMGQMEVSHVERKRQGERQHPPCLIGCHEQETKRYMNNT